MNQNAIRLKIKELMVRTSTTQSALAHQIGVSQSTLSAILNGHSRLTLDHLEQIAQVFKVPVRELLPPASEDLQN